MTKINEITLTSMVPHMLPAMTAWLLENNLTPEILVDAAFPGVDVPIAYVKDNRIILNINPISCSHVTHTAEGIDFGARFNKIHHNLFVPYGAVLLLRAREFPINIPMTLRMSGGVPLETAPAAPAREVDRRDVGTVEFGGVVRKSRQGRFGVVDGSKPE